MSYSSTATGQEWWSRPQLERTEPIRTAGGFYRTAERGQSGLGGVPLIAAEDAVVAAVRLAYQVAETQVERSARLAQRLREAGDRAVGARSDRKAVDATEQMIVRAMMGALTWLEGVSGERDPLKRLMVAQYRLAGSLLGLTPSEEFGSSHREAPAAASGADAAAPAHPAPHGPDTFLGWVTVVLKGEHRRPVRIRRCDIARDALQGKVQFYSVAHIESESLTAEFAIDANGRATLTLETPRSAPPGLWRAAVCGATDVQIGLIEIEV
jgi:hypothetical protein